MDTPKQEAKARRAAKKAGLLARNGTSNRPVKRVTAADVHQLFAECKRKGIEVVAVTTITALGETSEGVALFKTLADAKSYQHDCQAVIPCARVELFKVMSGHGAQRRINQRTNKHGN
jgi:hypothetical protein